MRELGFSELELQEYMSECYLLREEMSQPDLSCSAQNMIIPLHCSDGPKACSSCTGIYTMRSHNEPVDLIKELAALEE